MPGVGSSLWLLPPSTHPLQPLLTDLISRTSATYSSPHLFIPHITLTSEIDPEIYGADPQAWLDALSLPARNEVVVKFESVGSDEMFFRKCYIAVEKEGVRGLGALARTAKERGDRRKAEEWVEEEWGPHLSLLYQDNPRIQGGELEARKEVVLEAGVRLDGEGKLGGWVGGEVVLVETARNAIKDWVPVAERAL